MLYVSVGNVIMYLDKNSEDSPISDRRHLSVDDLPIAPLVQHGYWDYWVSHRLISRLWQNHCLTDSHVRRIDSQRRVGHSEFRERLILGFILFHPLQ